MSVVNLLAGGERQPERPSPQAEAVTPAAPAGEPEPAVTAPAADQRSKTRKPGTRGRKRRRR